MCWNIFRETGYVSKQSEPAALDDGGQAGGIAGTIVQLVVWNAMKPSNVQYAPQALAMEGVNALQLCS